MMSELKATKPRSTRVAGAISDLLPEGRDTNAKTGTAGAASLAVGRGEMRPMIHVPDQSLDMGAVRPGVL